MHFRGIRLIASGKTVGEIAKQLSRGEKTISTYRARILDRMKMKWGRRYDVARTLVFAASTL